MLFTERKALHQTVFRVRSERATSEKVSKFADVSRATFDLARPVPGIGCPQDLVEFQAGHSGVFPCHLGQAIRLFCPQGSGGSVICLHSRDFIGFELRHFFGHTKPVARKGAQTIQLLLIVLSQSRLSSDQGRFVLPQSAPAKDRSLTVSRQSGCPNQLSQDGVRVQGSLVDRLFDLRRRRQWCQGNQSEHEEECLQSASFSVVSALCRARNRSTSVVFRRATALFFTAIPMAFFVPITTTRSLARVIAV